jgi:predicted metal-dependent phosphotriesterase family hydrolase
MQRINDQVDINIIVAAGLYTFDEIPHFYHHRGPGTILDGPELMTEMFVNDIRHGIGGTEVRAAFVKGVVEERGLTAESYKTALLPRWNYTHIIADVLPALREHGVDEAQITAMLVHNPARYFTGGPE